MSHIWHESCHTYAWVRSHICKSRVTTSSPASYYVTNYGCVTNYGDTRCHELWWYTTSRTMDVTHLCTSHVTTWSPASSRTCCTCMTVSSRIWTSHVAYERVMSHTNEWWHIWTSHVTYEWVMAHTKESRHDMVTCIFSSLIYTHQWVMSHMNESRHTWMSHVTHKWVTSQYAHQYLVEPRVHVWMSHVTHESVMSHI